MEALGDPCVLCIVLVLLRYALESGYLVLRRGGMEQPGAWASAIETLRGEDVRIFKARDRRRGVTAAVTNIRRQDQPSVDAVLPSVDCLGLPERRSEWLDSGIAWVHHDVSSPELARSAMPRLLFCACYLSLSFTVARCHEARQDGALQGL